MVLDTEAFQKEVDSALDAKEAEIETAAGVRGAEASEEVDSGSEQEVESVKDVGSTDPEAEREEVEAKKVLGDEDSSKDIATDTDDKTPVQFDDTVLARAVACGITLTEARSFPDNGELNRFVDSVERNLVADVPEKEQTKQDDEPDLFAGLPDLNPDDYSPEVLQHLDRYKEVLLKQQEQMNASDARADSDRESIQDVGRTEMVEWYDKAVADLGDDYKETLGEGAFGLLSETSQAYENRNDIAGQMAILHDGYVAQGIQPPSREALFETAIRVVLPNEQNGIQRRKLEGELEQQASQHIQRPGGVNSKSSKTPEEETAELLDEKYG